MKSNLTKLTVAVAMASALVACGGDNSSSSDKEAKAKTLSFEGIGYPATDAEKRSIVAAKAVVDGKTYGGAYNTLVRSGQKIGDVTFGQLVDQKGNVLKNKDGSVRVSDSNEFTSLLPVGKKLFSVSQIESRPGAMFLMELNQDKKNGALSVKSLKQIDQSSVDGGWVHCAGSVTPWNTHLASEEYERNARKITNAEEIDGYGKPMLDYYTNKADYNPYFHGFNIEVAVKEDGSYNITKHYAMGRLAFELAYVMPDKKTVFMTDDGTNVGFYMFVADKAGDLSSGSLYAMKWNQTSGAGVGSANLEWVSLGKATDSAIKDYVKGTNGKKKLAFTDIFETSEPSEDGKCAAGFSSVNAGGNGHECLKLKDGMEMAASRMETRRYAAMMGATTELRKEEGVTYDSKRNKLYLAISSVERGMENFKKNGKDSKSYDQGGPNHIKLDGFNKCGAVYELALKEDSKVGSKYVPTTMAGLVAGRPVGDKDPQVKGFEKNNSCHIDGIANPDNVTYMSGYDYLIIGEDTGSGHQNDLIWAYSFKDKKLTRIQSTPYGAETTSPYWYPNINGWAYMTSVVQHPYGESDKDKNTGAGEARAYTGYLGPFPAVK